MKKLLMCTAAFYGGIIGLVVLLALPTKASAHTVEATFYLKTKHYEDDYRDQGVNYALNESHSFIGLE